MVWLAVILIIDSCCPDSVRLLAVSRQLLLHERVSWLSPPTAAWHAFGCRLSQTTAASECMVCWLSPLPWASHGSGWLAVSGQLPSWPRARGSKGSPAVPRQLLPLGGLFRSRAPKVLEPSRRAPRGCPNVYSIVGIRLKLIDVGIRIVVTLFGKFGVPPAEGVSQAVRRTSHRIVSNSFPGQGASITYLTNINGHTHININHTHTHARLLTGDFGSS
jgi:hypothetical protein